MLRAAPDTVIHSLRERRLAGTSAAALAAELAAREPAATASELASLFRHAFGLSSAVAERMVRAGAEASSAEASSADAGALEPLLGRPGSAGGALVGAQLGDGRFTLLRSVAGLSASGLFAGHTAQQAPILLSASPAPSAPLDAVHAGLLPHAAASVPLLWLGPYAPGVVLVEGLPGASSRDAWSGAQPAARVIERISELAALAEGVHASGGTLQGLRPETLGVDAATGRLWWTTRAERLLAGAIPRQGTAPLFERTYRAPDTSDAHPVSPASDVFTLAVLAAEWLHGRHPFEAPTSALHYLSVLSATLAFDPHPVPRSAFARDPKSRPSLKAFVGELGALLA